MIRTIYQDQRLNAIRTSEVRRMEAEVPFRGIGVKYVISGQETYFINGKKHVVGAGEYVIGNDATSSIVHIDQRRAARGLCVDISAAVVKEVTDYYDVHAEALKDFLLSDQFFVNRYRNVQTQLGRSLATIGTHLTERVFDNNFYREELFYELAEAVVADQRYVFDRLKKLRFGKETTRREVLYPLLEAKAILDEEYLTNLSLDELSVRVGMSKYHLVRMFRVTFDESPYRYQKLKRLERARAELIAGGGTLETALLCGYADVPTFSKAFKLVYGHGPGAFRK